MFTAERVALLLLAISIITWACIVIIDKRSPKAELPETTATTDSVNVTVRSDTVISDTLSAVKTIPEKVAGKGVTDAKKKIREQKKKSGPRKNEATKKKAKRQKAENPRDHLNEPIPQD